MKQQSGVISDAFDRFDSFITSVTYKTKNNKNLFPVAVFLDYWSEKLLGVRELRPFIPVKDGQVRTL